MKMSCNVIITSITINGYVIYRKNVSFIYSTIRGYNSREGWKVISKIQNLCQSFITYHNFLIILQKQSNLFLKTDTKTWLTWYIGYRKRNFPSKSGAKFHRTGAWRHMRMLKSDFLPGRSLHLKSNWRWTQFRRRLDSGERNMSWWRYSNKYPFI